MLAKCYGALKDGNLVVLTEIGPGLLIDGTQFGALNKIKTIVGDFGQLLLGACARADKYGEDKRYSDFMKETDILGLLLVPFCKNL